MSLRSNLERKGFNMTKRSRNKKINFWVTEEEKNMIDGHIKSLGYQNRSAFLRSVVFETTLIKTDLEPIKKLASEINAIGNNVNQIARKANQENTVDEKAIVEILQKQKEIEKLTLMLIDIFIEK